MQRITKKKITGAVLAAVLCLAGIIWCQGGAVRIWGAQKEAGRRVYEDVSGYVVQEGGFLTEAQIPSIKSMADRTKESRIREALIQAWESFSGICDLSAYQVTSSELKTAYFNTLNQFPKYFFVKSEYGATLRGGTVIQVEISYNVTDKDTLQQMREEYDRTAAAVCSKADASWSELEKALYIHDYLARSCVYDTGFAGYSSYDALVGRKAVCQGYALAFKELAGQLGLPCEIVTSDSLNHAWNLVNVNGSYYHADATWDDPSKDRLGWAKHQFFLKSSRYFMSDTGSHKADDWNIISSTAQLEADDTKYDNYFWNAVNTGFEYIAGAWYGFDGAGSIGRYACSGVDFSLAAKIAQMHDTWPSRDGGYWKGSFAGIASLNGKLYYSGVDTIYALDVNTGSSTPALTLTPEQRRTGCIYGIHVTLSGTLQYALSASPNESGQIYSAGCFGIIFEGNGAESGAMAGMDALEAGKEYPLPANRFRKNGYLFAGWNTRADGSGISYADKAVIRSDAGSGIEIRLYAQWKLENGHAHTQIRDAAEADCTQDGYTGNVYCLDCGGLVTQGTILKRLPHTPVIDKAVPPSCTTDGKTEGSHCGKCSALIKAQQAVPASGHSWNAFYTVDKAASASETGKESIHCSNCSAVKDERIIPKLNAKPSEGTSGKEDSAGNTDNTDGNAGKEDSTGNTGDTDDASGNEDSAGNTDNTDGNAGKEDSTGNTGDTDENAGNENGIENTGNTDNTNDKKLLKSIAVKKTRISIRKKDSAKIKWKSSLDMQNVKKIVYKSSNKAAAVVSQNGKITGKKAGTAVIKAAVTLNNGLKKTVSIYVRVK